MHFLWFREGISMVEPLHKIVSFVFHEWRYICGFPDRRVLVNSPWSSYMSRAVCNCISASSSVQWSQSLTGDRILIILRPEPRLISLMDPSAMIYQGKYSSDCLMWQPNCLAFFCNSPSVCSFDLSIMRCSGTPSWSAVRDRQWCTSRFFFMG